MAINSVSSSNPLDQLAQALVSRFDANKDGQLTTEEFTSFLSQFLGSAGSALTNGHANGVTSGTATANGLHGTIPPVMRGFDAGKLADLTHTTIKYQFARVAQQYSLESVHDKTSGEALLNSMRDDLTAAGLNILDIKGDSIKIKDDAGQEAWIDVIQSCGGGNPAWQWLDTRF
jgi:hypothetical protein